MTIGRVWVFHRGGYTSIEVRAWRASAVCSAAGGIVQLAQPVLGVDVGAV